MWVTHMKPSSPRQCSHSPLGEMHEATKSPPSARPELIVLTTCKCPAYQILAGIAPALELKGLSAPSQ